MEQTKQKVITTIHQIRSAQDIATSMESIDSFLASGISDTEKAEVRQAVRMRAKEMRQECQRIRQRLGYAFQY